MQQESPLLSPTREGTNGSDLKSIRNKDHQCRRAVGDGRHVSRVIIALGCNTRELRKNNTNVNFCKLVTALRKAMSRGF